MTQKRPYTMRARRSPGKTLLRLLISRGGSATLWQISRATATGRLLADANRELDGLIVTEQSRGTASKRPVTRVSLTIAGLAAAQALRSDWTPSRLAKPVLKAWLEELQQERDPWALSLLRDAEDARSWRAHEQQVKRHEIVCGPPKPKARPRGRPFGSPAKSALPAADTFLEPTYSVTGKPDDKPAPTPPAAHCRRCGHCERCHLNSEFCQCGTRHVCGRRAPAYSPSNFPIEATSQGDGEDSVNRAKIEAGGYGTAIRGANKIAYGGAVIGFEEFVRRMQL